MNEAKDALARERARLKANRTAHRLITYEQQRSASHELVRETLHDLKATFELQPDLDQKVRDLLSIRQDLLDQLILATNLPGVTEIILEHRTTLDGGSRFAISGPDGAAKILGIKPTTLRSRMERLGCTPGRI